MDKRFSWIFLLASGAFFLFIVGFTGYRTEDTRRNNAAAARESAATLSARIHSLADTTGSVQSPPFKTAMRALFEADSRLLLLSVHTPQDGILYFVSRSSSALKEPSAISPQWRGTPSYRVNRGSEILVTSGLESTAPGMSMDALFIVMGKEDLYPIVRDDLYFFLAFLLVCGVAILIVMSIETDTGPGSAASRGQAPGHSAPPSYRPVDLSEPTAPPFEPSSEPSTAHGSPGAARGLTSPRTGLVWAEYLEPRLRAELERAASADSDISLAQVRLDEPFADSRLPMAYGEIAGMLKSSFPLHDLIFEAGDDSFSLILPDVDVDAAVRQLDEVRAAIAARSVQGRTRTLSIGVSSRGGRLIEEKVLRDEAQVAVAKAAREGGNQVVGFRADAARFRESLTGRVS
jgi:hypothetical protein